MVLQTIAIVLASGFSPTNPEYMKLPVKTVQMLPYAAEVLVCTGGGKCAVRVTDRNGKQAVEAVQLCDVEVPETKGKRKRLGRKALDKINSMVKRSTQAAVIMPYEPHKGDLMKPVIRDGKIMVWLVLEIKGKSVIVNFKLAEKGLARYKPIGCGRPTVQAEKDLKL